MHSINPASLPSSIPVMLLHGCTLFPHALLPLFIYEPRYRKMLRHALEADRIFCIASYQAPGGGVADEDAEADHHIVPHTTAGIIRACVVHANGTAHLMLQGAARIRIADWEQREPFRIARVKPQPSINANAEENNLLARRLLRIVTRLLDSSGTGKNEVGEQLRSLRNPEAMADFVAANFLQDAERRQRILSLQDVGQRLHHLLRWLEPKKA